VKRDHDILHYFYDNPNAASTSHALVKNDSYGISHEVAYQQDVLTKEQIKSMHDNWVSIYEPAQHSTPLGGKTAQEAQHDLRWDSVVIRNPKNGQEVTKRDIYRYYSTPEVKNKLFAQVQNKEVMVRQVLSPEEGWIKRVSSITKNTGDASNTEDLQYYIERRHVEFNPAMSSLEDRLVIDLDPGNGLSLEDVKKVAAYVNDLLKNQPYIKDTEIQFSGNRGFYVWGILHNKQNVNSLREQLKNLFYPIKKMNGINVSLKQNPSKNTVRLDLSPMKVAGSVKADGSLDYRTGYIAKKFPINQLGSFTPEKDASIKNMKLKPAYSFKDEELV
jgi:hypothetical protein